MNSLNSLIEPAATHAHDGIDRVVSKASPAIDKAAEVAHRTINRVADAAVPAAEWALQGSHQVTEKYNSALDTCQSFVKARPIATVIGAVFLGYMFGRFQR